MRKGLTLVVLAFVVISSMAATMLSVVSLVLVSAGTTCATTINVDLPQATIDYLENRNVDELAIQNRERYQYAEDTTGVPWEVMAALHYREAGMNPNSSISNGAPLGSGVNVDGVDVVSNANEDAKRMAELFKRNALSFYKVDVSKLDEMTTEDWGEAFLAYNRGSLFLNKGVSYTQSPYVMNGLDDSHMNMSWTYADTVRGVDGNKAGALAVLAYLEGVPLVGGNQPDVCSGGSVVAPVDAETQYVTSGAEIRTRSNGKTRAHEGIDIVGGSSIVAMSGGIVILAANNVGGYGTTVKIDHGNGNYTLYGHMVYNSLEVTEGQSVVAGQRLGTMGDTGDSEGVHLHFQIWVENVLINPFAYLKERGVKVVWTENAYPRNETPGPIPHN